MNTRLEQPESDASADVAELTRRMLADLATVEGDGVDWKSWSGFEESGLTELLRPEEEGGAGAGWPEVAALLVEVGAAAARLPVAEHDVLAGWLVRTAGLPDAGPRLRTAGLFRDGVARSIPWARQCDSVVLLEESSEHGWRATEAVLADLDISPGVNLAGEYRDDVRLAGSTSVWVQIDEQLVTEFILRLTLTRAFLIAGAAQRILALVVEHASTREQFGRPLARFQAVQRLIAGIAAEAGLIRAATDGAVQAVRQNGIDNQRSRVAILSAASCAAHGGSVLVRQAHQVLGAMGYTLEHPLHRLTNRILSWRAEAGSVHSLDLALLNEVSGLSPTHLWSLLVDTGLHK